MISPEIAVRSSVRSSVISGAGLQTTELWRVLISRRTHAKAECGSRQFIRREWKFILAVPDDRRGAPAGYYLLGIDPIGATSPGVTFKTLNPPGTHPGSPRSTSTSTMAFSYPFYQVLTILGMVLVLMATPFHLNMRGASTWPFIFWLFIWCLLSIVNSIVWRDNMDIIAPTFCDICASFLSPLQRCSI